MARNSLGIRTPAPGTVCAALGCVVGRSCRQVALRDRHAFMSPAIRRRWAAYAAKRLRPPISFPLRSGLSRYTIGLAMPAGAIIVKPSRFEAIFRAYRMLSYYIACDVIPIK